MLHDTWCFNWVAKSSSQSASHWLLYCNVLLTPSSVLLHVLLAFALQLCKQGLATLLTVCTKCALVPLHIVQQSVAYRTDMVLVCCQR